MAINKNQPELKNLDDLFDRMEQQPVFKNVITSVSIEKLVPFNKNPFRLYSGERLDDMTESIRKNGILVPIIVRGKGAIFEILSGHNRVNAGTIAGLKEIPAIILENISDDEAMVYVVETNLIQRSFVEMTYSEKAAVIALHHSQMFSQGKRNDILEQIKLLENPHRYNGNETLPQIGAKLRTDEKIGDKYSLSKNTIARYLRINKLIPKLKNLLDDGNINFIPAVTISFLKEDEQPILNEYIIRYKFSVDIKKAEIMRQYSEKNKLDGESIYKILSGETTQKKSNRVPAVKISKTVYAKYFQPEQSVKEIQEIIEKALQMYFDRQ